MGPWARHLLSLGAASVSPPVKWGRRRPGSGRAVLTPGPGHEAQWCCRALPLRPPSTLPFSHAKYKTKPYMVAEEPGLPLTSGGRSQGLWLGTASQPGAPGRGLAGCDDDTEAQPACPAVLLWEGHVWGSFWAGPHPRPPGDVLWAAIIPPAASGSVSESHRPGGHWSSTARRLTE